jgi:hypothetical protein
MARVVEAAHHVNHSKNFFYVYPCCHYRLIEDVQTLISSDLECLAIQI